VISAALLLAALTLLLIAAGHDIRTRRIPNWATTGIAALYPVYVLTAPLPLAVVPWAFALAMAVFLIGLVCFHYGVMGGGDVKLLTALTLWAGPDLWLTFLIVTMLAGGGLALVVMWYERSGYAVLAPIANVGGRLVRLGREPAATAAGGGDVAGTEAEDPPNPRRRPTLPYGVAIALGGVLVFRNLAGI
jgi:prepilin peptidase CpaA